MMDLVSDGSNPSPRQSGASQARRRSSVSRRAAEKERVRVSRACDRCKGKKIRCTGKKPCALCVRQGLSCEYNARYTRGRVPSIESDDAELTHQGLTPPRPLSGDVSTAGEQQSQDVPADQVDHPEAMEPANTENLDAVVEHAMESAVQSSRNSPEPSQTDRQGHYVGPSSGLSFLLRAQKRLHKIVSLSQNSSIFTFGDTPLPDFDSSFFVLPPKERAAALVARYFDFAFPTHRFLHRPTVELWLEELYGNLGVMRERVGEKGKRAVLFMVLAQAEEYMIRPGDEADYQRSVRYFQAAEHQLRAETGEIRLTSVQARLAQCFYLLSESRINHCWSLFGTTAHLLLALGVHRKIRRREVPGKYDLIEIECRKRVFWTAYTLDNYLSAALGRPRAFHDDDIDQELPSIVQDSELTATRILPPPSKSQSIMLAGIYHAKLAQIISGILKDMYNIRPSRPEVRETLAAKHNNALRQWRQGIAHFLDVDASLLNPLFQRQSNVLRLAHAHALILVHRPFLLWSFEDLARGSHSRASARYSRAEESVGECLRAALTIVGIVNEICEGGQHYRAFWFTNYYAFCAVVVIYVFTIQRQSDPPSTWHSYFAAAEKCQHQISSGSGEKDSFAQRYSIVLEELRQEALKQIESAAASLPKADSNADTDTEVAHTILRLADNPNSHLDAYTIPPGPLPSAPLRNFQGMENNVSSPMSYPPQQLVPFQAFDGSQPDMSFAQEMSDTSPQSLVADATGWGEFDSFVTAGIGGFDGSYFNSLDGLNGVERWDFSTLNKGMPGG